MLVFLSYASDTAEDALRGANLLIGLTTGNEVIAVQPLSADPSSAADELAKVMLAASTLREHLDERERQDPRVHANVCVHVDEVSFRMSTPIEVIGGPLM